MRLSTFIAAALSSAFPASAQSDETSSSILEKIENAASCAACNTLLLVLQGVAHLGNDAFVDLITGVCTLAGVEDPDVCAGAVGGEGPILAHDLRQIIVPSDTSQAFCATIFGLCQYAPPRDYEVSFPSPKPDTSRPEPSGKEPIRIVHFSDIHVDLQYTAGANYNCTKNICCRPYTAEDEPGNTDFPAGPNGNHKCDSPKTLEQSLNSAVQEFAPDAAFAMFTGDVVEGAVWLVNQSEVTGDLNDAYSTMASNLGMTLLGATGNHDVAPVNSFPPGNIETTISSDWAYDTLSENWEQWIGNSGASQADKYGAYSYKVPNLNLKVISINTNLFYKQNFWLYEKEMQYDPNGQLAWLVEELQGAETASQRAYVIGHMPIGTSDALRDGSNYMNQILRRYEATIAGLFFGHTHKDEFQIGYTSYDARSAETANSMSWVAPALTPTSGSPAFRVYSVDPVTFGVLDMAEYSTDLEASTYQTRGPVWSKYYSAKETYGPLVSPPVTDAAAELSPAFWHKLTDVFESDDDVFQAYNARKSRGWNVSSCTGDCKNQTICQLRAAESQYNCGTVSPGINLRKRDAEVAALEHSECDGSKVAGFMSAIAGIKA